MGQITIAIFGNVTDRRAEAEISWHSGETRELIAVVYDTHDGWMTRIEDTALVREAGSDFHAAVEKARERLTEYVNRLGDGSPDGLTVAGLSLWLLEKANGTAMGYQLGGKDG